MKGTHMRQNEPDSSDDDIEALLRRTGARDSPPSAAMEEVRRAVHAEWRTVANARGLKRRAIIFGVAASVATVILALVMTLRSISPPQPIAVAVLERVTGSVTRQSTDDSAAPMSAGRVIMTGDNVVTSADALAAIRMNDISVRMDSNTTLAVLAHGRVELRSGAIYIDAGPTGSRHQPLEIDTVAGRVQHLGTQYQIRAGARDVTISVREGRVQLALKRGPQTAAAGEQLVVSPGGEVVRDQVAAHDASWAWVSRIAPPFQIENQPLTAFLQWVARETGGALVYSSPDLELAAASITLHGSIANLTPEAALAAILSTTQFERVPAEDGVLRIGLRSRR
jgi:ferric-dicitrate binding protein FerR (iron transport regulator)